MSIILARMTSKYGNVYFAARRLNSIASSADRSIWYGLFLGIYTPSSQVTGKMLYVAVLVNYYTCVYLRKCLLRKVEKGLRIAAESREKTSVPILIIEDDEALLKLYRLRLSKWSFDVTIHTASNGFEGVIMVGEVAPRLLICDLRLPGVSGFQIVRTLSRMQKFEELTIVVVSGMAHAEINAHGGIPQGVELMSKPINFARLSEIAKALSLRKMLLRPDRP